MNKTEILNIVNEPSKHIQIVKIDGKDSIVYSSKFVELLELIPTMLTKADMVDILEELLKELKELPKARFYKTNEFGDVTGCIDYPAISKNALDLIQQKINALKENI